MMSTQYCKILKHLNFHVIPHLPAMLHSNACVHVDGSIEFSGRVALGNNHPEVKETSSNE
jgi:hypothetical protein